MIVDTRRERSPIPPLVIKGERVEVVDTFKFLGKTIANKLKWEGNTFSIISKCHQRLYFLRKLKKFGVSKLALKRFYQAAIESILSFSITSWYGAITVCEKAALNKIVYTSSKIIGSPLETLDNIYEKRTSKKIRTILANADHPANKLFVPLPSGKRFQSIKAKTNRFRDSFYVKSTRESHPE